MNEKTLIDTKEPNRLMRSHQGSGSVFVQAGNVQFDSLTGVV